jgi:ABC-2 type transport system ATP-binding protein
MPSRLGAAVRGRCEVVSIDLRGACVDFPIFDAKGRSLKKTLLSLAPMGKTGGKIGIDRRVPISETLRDVTVSLRQGDRLAW